MGQDSVDSTITPSAISLESVPEPSSWSFVLAGLCGLGVVLRFRQKMVA